MDKLTLFFNGKKVSLVIQASLGTCVGMVVQNKGALGMDNFE